MSPPSLQLQRWQDLAAAERQAVLNLQIATQQVEYAGSVDRAVASCEQGPAAEVAGLAILEGACVVGFVVLLRGSRRPDWAPPGAAALTAMRIDAARQGQGLGRRALAAVDDWLRRHWPEQPTLALSVDDGNQAGRKAYAAAGFAEYTEPKPGRIGLVRYLARPLSPAA